MTMLAETKEAQALSLADYEARIHLYREQIGSGYIGIGRTLNEAKAAKVVPHGEWEAWVERTTGLSARNAQRCMQAATEIRDGSQLARLEMSKALLLLASGLAQDEQEEIARKAAEDGTSLRALQEEVRQMKLKAVREAGVTEEVKQALKKAEGERDQLAAQMRAQFRQFQERLEDETTRAYDRGRQENEEEIRKQVRKEEANKLDFIKSQRDLSDAALKDLRKALEEAKADNSRKWDQGFNTGMTERNQLAAEVERLKRNQADLLEAADNAEKRAIFAEAEAAQLRAGAEENREPAARRLRMAVNDFLVAVESIEWTPGDLHRARPLIEVSVEDVEAWSERMWDMLRQHPVDGEGVVV